MSTEFKVGDVVELTGSSWRYMPGGSMIGEEHIITRVSEDGYGYFLDADGNELVTSLDDGVFDAVVVKTASAVSKLPHYNSHPSGIEAIEIVKHESFLRGNVLKYVLRAHHKGNELEDLLKAQYYLDLEVKRAQGDV